MRGADLLPLVVHADDQIDDALLQLHDGGIGLAAVVDDHDVVIGTVRDGDIRRAIVAGADATEPVGAFRSDRPGTVAPATPDA